LRLILFGGEEQGLYGSMQYVAQMPPAERRKINAVVNMDMIAVVNNKDSPKTVLLEGADPVSKKTIERLSAAAHNYTTLEVRTSMNPYNSDHVPFIGVGVPSVLTIEGFDQTNERVHNASDTLDRLNYDLMHEILRMNTAFVGEKLGHV
jgi:Zn-dependent M28 family amino/carboxypeptidase